jgi:hypothetical protein
MVMGTDAVAAGESRYHERKVVSDKHYGINQFSILAMK